MCAGTKTFTKKAKGKDTHPTIHECFGSSFYQTSACLKVGVFPTAGWNKQGQEKSNQVQELQASQEVVICQETGSTVCSASQSIISSWHLARVKPAVMSQVSLSTHTGPWWGQRKLGHLYLLDLLLTDAAHPTNHPQQGHALPYGPPASAFCVFALPSPSRCHREHPCSRPLLLSTGTPQKSQISMQFPVQCLFGGKGAGGAGCMKKESHSQTVWAAFEGKHVQEGYVRRAVKSTETRVFWSWHTDPTSAGTQSSTLFRPQPPQSDKHPSTTSWMYQTQRPLLETSAGTWHVSYQ